MGSSSAGELLEGEEVAKGKGNCRSGRGEATPEQKRGEFWGKTVTVEIIRIRRKPGVRSTAWEPTCFSDQNNK